MSAIVVGFQVVSRCMQWGLLKCATAQLWAVRQAYTTLSDPVKRIAYDQLLASRKTSAEPVRAIGPQPERFSWNFNFILLALLASGLVGFGLHLGRADKKDAHTAQMTQTQRSADNESTRATTERVWVDGSVQNQSKLIDTQGQVANRIVSVEESAESRRSRELEYRANAGAELLRQQQERTKLVNDQLNWERKQYEQDAVARQAKARVASDRMQSIQYMVQDGRYAEAASYAQTPEEQSFVRSARRR